jgi:hypothetical protein
MTHGIEITLQPVYLKNDYIYIPAAVRSFFPPGKPFSVSPIIVESGGVSFTAELQFNSKGYI